MVGFKQFESNMRKRGQQVITSAAEAVKKVALVVDQRVVEATPVDTGKARSNWIASLNAPVTSTREPYSPGAGGSTAAANAAAAIQQASTVISTAKPGDEVWLSNSVPYIGDLNNGSSTQAPENFVQTAAMSGLEELRNLEILE